MKLGIIIYSNDSETVWNALNLGLISRAKGDEVNIFLLGKGVQADSINTGAFNVTELIGKFINVRGNIFACGSCLKRHETDCSSLCPVPSMEELYDIIKTSDRLLTF